MKKLKPSQSNNQWTPNVDAAHLFHFYWVVLVGIPELKRLEVRNKEHGGELRFAKDHNGRRWSFDWCIPSVKVAVEVDGGRAMCKKTRYGKWVAVGHHNTDDDLEKSNTALELGWAVFHFSPKMLNTNPHNCVRQVASVIISRLENIREGDLE